MPRYFVHIIVLFDDQRLIVPWTIHKMSLVSIAIVPLKILRKSSSLRGPSTSACIGLQHGIMMQIDTLSAY